ncbi:MAG: putative esterase [Actinomycetia bacterium]|nr:putative esterase [Actinomycetes bacterium]
MADCVTAYRWLLDQGALPVDPLLSPCNGDLSQLPPVLIQCGSTEVLRVDAELMASRLAEAGVPVRLQIWEGQVHVSEGHLGIAEIGTHIRGCVADAGELAA